MSGRVAGVARKCASCGHEFTSVSPRCPCCGDGYGLAGGVDPKLLDALRAARENNGVSDWVGESVHQSLVDILQTSGFRHAVFELFWLLRECWQKPFPEDNAPFPWSVFSGVGLLDEDPQGVSICAECWRSNRDPVRVWAGKTRFDVKAQRELWGDFI